MRHAAKVSGTACAVLALVVAPLTSVAAAEPAARDVREHACPPTSVAPPPYRDTGSDDTVFGFEIACMTEVGVVQGNGDRFFPQAPLTRGQAASLLQRARFVSRAAPAIRYADAFPDDDGSVHEDAIDWAAANGVVTGHADGTFRPGELVRRDQFASMVARLDGLDGHDLPPGGDAFADDDGSVHEPAINRLAGSGVMAGTGGSMFSPAASVTRGQAAAVVARLADVQVAAGRQWPLPANQLFSVDPAGPVFREQNMPDSGEDKPTEITLEISELQPGTAYRVVLSVPEDVDGQPPANGPVRFADRDDDGRADLRRSNARVTAVNGAPLAQGPQETVEVVAGPDGSVTVTVDNEQANGAVLVVYEADSAGLPVDENGMALEPFGASGDLTWFFPAVPASQRG